MGPIVAMVWEGDNAVATGMLFVICYFLRINFYIYNNKVEKC